MTFGNKTLALHLLRGAVGFGALAGSLWSHSIWLSMAFLPVALLALKGCPVCWTVGLFETVAMRVHARRDSAAGSLTAPHGTG